MLEARTYSIAELEKLSGFDRRTIVYYIQQGLVPRAGRRGPHTRYPEDGLLRLRFVRGLKDLQDQGRSDTVTLSDMRIMLAGLDSDAIRALVDGHFPPEQLAALRARSAVHVAPPTHTGTSPSAAPAAAAVSTPIPAHALTSAPSSAPSLTSSSARSTVGDGRSYGLADAGIRHRQQASTPSPVPPSAAAPLSHDETAPRLPALQLGGAETATQTPAEALQHLGELLRELEIRPAMSGRRLPPGSSEQWTEIPITGRVFLSVRGLSESDAPLADATGRALKKLLRAR